MDYPNQIEFLLYVFYMNISVTINVGAETVSLSKALRSWKDKSDLTEYCLTLLNSYTPSEVRQLSLGE